MAKEFKRETVLPSSPTPTIAPLTGSNYSLVSVSDLDAELTALANRQDELARTEAALQAERDTLLPDASPAQQRLAGALALQAYFASEDRQRAARVERMAALLAQGVAPAEMRVRVQAPIDQAFGRRGGYGAQRPTYPRASVRA